MLKKDFKNSIVWFRKCLRIHDNKPLFEALKRSEKVFPVFVIDPHFIDQKTLGINRLRFLLQSLEELDSGLKEKKMKLLVLKGAPSAVLGALMEEWSIEGCFFEKDSEPYAKMRDKEIGEMAVKKQVKVFSSSGHTLYDLDSLYEKNGRKVPLTYTSFLKLVEKMGNPAKPIDIEEYKWPEENYLEHMRMKDTEMCFKEDFSVPELESFEFGEPEMKEHPLKGGEKTGLEVMKKYLQGIKNLSLFIFDFLHPFCLLTN